MKDRIVYITRDIERALGIEPSLSYFIVTNNSEYARTIKEKYPDFVLLVESAVPLDTFEILEKEETIKFIEEKTSYTSLGNDQVSMINDQAERKPNVMVFKNTVRIEELCAKKGWNLLNPPSSLAEKIENKITQVEWLGELAELLPSFKIAPAKEIKWQKKTLVLQWAHAHTGEGTIVINDAATLATLQEKFPDRPAKASEFIKGPTFTVNVVVESKRQKVKGKSEGKIEIEKFENRVSERGGELSSARADARDEKVTTPARCASRFSQDDNSVVVGGADREPLYNIAIGNPSYQITGMPPLTDSPFATVGNDWSLPHDLLNGRHLEELRGIALKVGKKIQESGWRGLFGIDVIYDEGHDLLKLIEINARQPASTTYESQLQSKFRGHDLVGATIFESHLAALTDSPLTEKQIEINDGAQLVQRVTKTLAAQMVEMSRKIADLNKAGYTTILYPNTKLNSDFLRIQSDKGLMEKHGKWNARGEKIIEILEK